jgi:hypothetical protein
VIKVSWMARNNCQQASRPPRLAVLSLRPVLWSVPYIGLAAGVHRKIPTPPIASTPILSHIASTPQMIAPLASPFSNTETKTSICVYCTCFVSRNLFLLHHSCSSLCGLPQGYHPEQTQAT